MTLTAFDAEQVPGTALGFPQRISSPGSRSLLARTRLVQSGLYSTRGAWRRRGRRGGGRRGLPDVRCRRDGRCRGSAGEGDFRSNRHGRSNGRCLPPGRARSFDTMIGWRNPLGKVGAPVRPLWNNHTVGCGRSHDSRRRRDHRRRDHRLWRRRNGNSRLGLQLGCRNLLCWPRRSMRCSGRCERQRAGGNWRRERLGFMMQ